MHGIGRRCRSGKLERMMRHLIGNGGERAIARWHGHIGVARQCVNHEPRVESSDPGGKAGRDGFLFGMAGPDRRLCVRVAALNRRSGCGSRAGCRRRHRCCAGRKSSMARCGIPGASHQDKSRRRDADGEWRRGKPRPLLHRRSGRPRSQRTRRDRPVNRTASDDAPPPGAIQPAQPQCSEEWQSRFGGRTS